MVFKFSIQVVLGASYNILKLEVYRSNTFGDISHSQFSRPPPSGQREYSAKFLMHFLDFPHDSKKIKI